MKMKKKEQKKPENEIKIKPSEYRKCLIRKKEWARFARMGYEILDDDKPNDRILVQKEI